MKALRNGRHGLELDEVGRPEAAGEALVRVLKSGICNTDLEIVRGYAGFEGTIGHEFVGIVEAADDAPGLKGKRVVGEINVGCSRCAICYSGDQRHCRERTVLGIKGRDGAHAEFLNLPAQNLIEVPDNVNVEQAVFVEPLAAALGITEHVEVGRATRVAIIGDGKLGILCSFALRLFSENVSLFGRHRQKLSIVERRDIDVHLTDEAEGMNSLFDIVVEASGSGSGFAAALDLVRPRGKIVLKSTFQGKPEWEAWRVVVDEISIVGSRCGRFAPALELLATCQIDLTGLISEEFELKDGKAAFEAAAKKGALKVLLSMT